MDGNPMAVVLHSAKAKPLSSAPRAARRKLALLADLRDQVRRLEAERGKVQHLMAERDRQALVLRLNRILLEHLDPEPMALAISSALWDLLHHDVITLSAIEEGGTVERLLLLDRPELRGKYKIGAQVPERVLAPSRVADTHRIDVLGPDRIANIQPPEMALVIRQEDIQALCQVPLFSRGRTLGILSVGSRNEQHFTAERLQLLEQVAGLVAVALDNTMAFQDIRSSRDKLAEERLYLEEEARRDFSTHEIIGSSPAVVRVLKHIETVAPSDATVLLLGETGTGKELLARATHERSKRRAHTFVRLNCSAIPLGLVESELFGHERGAFTGAIARKVGRFELAHQGTLFLDEIGDLPLDLQPKLLRAIQEREFERLGGNCTIRVDVRLIAATHRDLARMVAQGTFRQDLFYRLNVFPIQVPPLRERKEDIPRLVRYFVQKFAKALDRRIERIPAETMAALVDWPWPGNIRELQNLVERSVILSPGPELRVPLGELDSQREVEAVAPAVTLEDQERKAILVALESSGGMVGGSRGAAARLGLKRTTLVSKMARLGLIRSQRPDVRPR
jgi:formate hydrogenlyase transcriptional activator